MGARKISCVPSGTLDGICMIPPSANPSQNKLATVSRGHGATVLLQFPQREHEGQTHVDASADRAEAGDSYHGNGRTFQAKNRTRSIHTVGFEDKRTAYQSDEQEQHRQKMGGEFEHEILGRTL